MSLVLANIKVEFTAKYVGNHRLCYRLGSSGDYTCITVNCAAEGDCQGLIPIFVENESCDAVEYTGYVQPSCVDVSSTDKRVPWTFTFTPVPSCHLYNVECTSLGVASVTITNGGADYATPPTVSFVGDGTATGVAVIGGGKILTASIFNSGSGYANGTHTGVHLDGGSGSGAIATVVVLGGEVISVTITSQGTGYLNIDQLVPRDADMGGAPAVLALFEITTDYGTVTAVTSINNTVDFTSVPSVVFTGGGGTGAEGTAVMEDCPELTNTGCTGSPLTIGAGTLDLGESISLCGPVAPTVPDNYTVTANGNCVCDCVVATLGIVGSTGNRVAYFYNDCAGAAVSGTLTKGGSPSSIVACVVPGSVAFKPLIGSPTGTVSYGAECP